MSTHIYDVRLQRYFTLSILKDTWFGELHYRGPNLRRSLTSERDSKYDPSDYQTSSPTYDTHLMHGSRSSKTEASDERNERKVMSQEERLLELVTTPGGVRLQPSREAVQNFLTGAVKLDGEKLGFAIEAKLQAHSWQVSIPYAMSSFGGD